MGDFDRHNQGSGNKKNETRKLSAVIVLGALLIGLVAFQFMKNGSNVQTAAGAQITGGAALPPPVVASEMSEQALTDMLNDLKNDPAKDLLRQAPQSDHALDAPPRNPFRMSSAWANSLINPVPAVPTPAMAQTQPNIEPRFTPVPPDPAPHPVVTLRPEDFKLSSIVNGNMAIINGKIVRAGDIVGKARIIAIHDDGVILQPAESTTAPTIELSIQNKLPNGQ